MARKRTEAELPTLFDLSKFEAKPKPQHPDDIDTDANGGIAWEVKTKQPKIDLNVGDWVKHQHKDAVGVLIKIEAAGTSVLGSDLTFCKVEWIIGNPGCYPEYKCLPGELERIERPNFLCNVFDGDNPETLHKKNGQCPNFLCNVLGDVTQETLHKKIHAAVEILTLPELERLLHYIQALIDRLSEAELDIPVRSDREVVESRRVGSIVYQLERVKCGKNCRKCPHGPYWYAYYRRGGKVASKYIGKELPG